MKLFNNPPPSQGMLEKDYPDLKGLYCPFGAVCHWTPIVVREDLQKWVEETFSGRTEEFWEALGINTSIAEGLYVWDVQAAVRRMNGKPTLWD